MKMRIVIAALFFTSSVAAQTLQDGRKLLLSQRYRTAKETMEKVVAAAPTNPEAIYWLAQVNFESKKSNCSKRCASQRNGRCKRKQPSFVGCDGSGRTH